MASNTDIETHERKKRTAAMSLAALGVVYGDIGTSPLYAFRESFLGGPPLDTSEAHVLGVLSLIIWAATIVISVKYLLVVMRADNHGEGGIIALVALLDPRRARPGSAQGMLVLTGLFGAALLYGDGTITPAISVLSAIEGVKIATDAFDPYIIPLTIVILTGLFLVQRNGTLAIGRLFGPVMLLWFAAIAILGIGAILQEPGVLRAFSPHFGLRFLATEGSAGFLVLGAVFLVVTGGETLYADMGHFGRKPIRLAWYGLVMPSLLLNYMGQGALVLSDKQEITHPFYHLAPQWALYPLVILATVATVIASQAVISGVFSLTRQAIHLNLLPRMRIKQTSDEEYGQIYIPLVNWLLMFATVALVFGFRSSANLASAYGVAISTDMVITTIIMLFIFTKKGWNPFFLVALGVIFLVTDLAFFGANLVKIPDGGWYPLVVGGFIFVIMTTWKQGSAILAKRLKHERLSISKFLGQIRESQIARPDGTAIFITETKEERTPPILMHQVKHVGALQKNIIMFHVYVDDVPRIPPSERLDIKVLADNVFSVRARYGFMQNINVPAALKLASKTMLPIDLDKPTYYLGRETLMPTDDAPGMASWRDNLFIFLNRNAHRATGYYAIPPEDVVELGVQVQI